VPFEGIGKGEVSREAVVSVYKMLLSTIWHEFRAACEKYSVEYPEAAEIEIRAYLQRDLGMFE
jgi:hypothetical protein